MKITNKIVMKKSLIAILVLAVFVVCLLIMYVFFRFVVTLDSNGPTSPREPVNVVDFSDSGRYKIYADTILKSIGSGHSPIFLPETTQIPDPDINSELTWKQSEYLKVVEELFKFQWKEPLSKDWNVYSMGFRRVCEENPTGFEYARFIFHRPSQGNDYEARLIEISLSDGTITWGSGSGYPQPLFAPSKHYLGDLKITADDALSIAEKKGGKAARQSVQNNCDLSIFLTENWKAVYYDSTLFEIIIDPYTGK